MKKLCTETPENEVVTKVLVENVEATRTAILKELFDLPSDTTVDVIINTPLRLPKMEVKSISEKRLKSIKKKYRVIPAEHIPYYPGGDDYLLNATEEDGLDSDDEGSSAPASFDKPKKRVGRPKAPMKNINTPSILNFFKALPAIPKKVGDPNPKQKLPTPPLAGGSKSSSSTTSRGPGDLRKLAPIDLIDCDSSDDESEKDVAITVGKNSAGKDVFGERLDGIYDAVIE